MRRSLGIVAVALAFGGVARAQAYVPEGDAWSCSDGRDNDGDGLADCRDPKCGGIAGCPAPFSVERGDVRLNPRRQMLGGALLLGGGVAVIAASIAVWTNVDGSLAADKRDVAYGAGGLLTAAGAGLGIGGAIMLYRGWQAWREDREMGLASRLRVEPRFAVGPTGAHAGVAVTF